MSGYDVDEMYGTGHFKQGKSRKVDEAITNLRKVLVSKPYSGSDFQGVWEAFLQVMMSEYPNISVYNLASLHLPMVARGLHDENLVVCRFIVDLYPTSAENQCFLGHAYRDTGHLELAAERYLKAYEYTFLEITTRHLASTDSLCLDACGYLCYLAETEYELRRKADALVHATRALAILREAKVDMLDEWRVRTALQRVFLDMGLDDLAEQMRIRAVEVKNKR